MSHLIEVSFRGAALRPLSKRCLLVILLFTAVYACTRSGAPPSSSAQASSIAALDSVWYVPPGGCAGRVETRSPPSATQIASGRSDTTKDLNAREAALARVVPGGWAGVWLDNGPVIGLVDTSRRVEAVRALYAHGYRANFDLMKARAQPVRWDFAQLVDWYNIIAPRAYSARLVSSSGIERHRNRIHLGIADSSGRRALVALLTSLEVPCYIVAIERGIMGRVH